jgi:hypothetical protein
MMATSKAAADINRMSFMKNLLGWH